MADLSNDLEKAFDYRGDVTLTLKDGREIVGFVFNFEMKGGRRCPEPFVELMIDGQANALVRQAEIASVAFTGEDAAAGKSWEDWQAKESARKSSANTAK